MKIMMVACTGRAYNLMKELRDRLMEECGVEEVICAVKCKALEEVSIKEDLGTYVGKYISLVDSIIFICATGIAVRTIAPFLSHKSIDPAVLVIDEQGKFCISLVSGHMGGANELATKVASYIGATPVVTTATDGRGKFSVDDFARRNHLYVSDWKKAKEISAALLEDKKILLERFEDRAGTQNDIIKRLENMMLEDACGDVCASSKLPECEGMCLDGMRTNELGIDSGNFIENNSVRNKIYFDYRTNQNDEGLLLIPKVIVAGIGCRKNTPYENIKSAIEQCCDEYSISKYAIGKIASIDLKKEETGIIQYCKENSIEFVTFSADVLREIDGDYTESEFVERVTGVANVCETSAVAASSQGTILVKKSVYDGVTVALSLAGNTEIDECM